LRRDDSGDEQGQSLAYLEIAVNLLMPDHGHGTPVRAYANAIDVVGRCENYTGQSVHDGLPSLWGSAAPNATWTRPPERSPTIPACV
jgi:hypothetical protein